MGMKELMKERLTEEVLHEQRQHLRLTQQVERCPHILYAWYTISATDVSTHTQSLYVRTVLLVGRGIVQVSRIQESGRDSPCLNEVRVVHTSVRGWRTSLNANKPVIPGSPLLRRANELFHLFCTCLESRVAITASRG